MKRYFCSKTVFNLSRNVLTKAEIRILEKGLGFATISPGLMKVTLRKILMNFLEKWGVNGILEMIPQKFFREISL